MSDKRNIERMLRIWDNQYRSKLERITIKYLYLLNRQKELANEPTRAS